MCVLPEQHSNAITSPAAQNPPGKSPSFSKKQIWEQSQTRTSFSCVETWQSRENAQKNGVLRGFLPSPGQALHWSSHYPPCSSFSETPCLILVVWVPTPALLQGW